MKIFEVHKKNWNDVKNFLGLYCRAPHLEIGSDYFTINNTYINKVSRFLGVGTRTHTFPHDVVYGGPQEKRKALTFKSIFPFDGPIFIGGVGLTNQLLEDEKEARLVDKIEQIHCSLAYLSPFYSMHLDPILESKERLMYKAFEEDIAWALLKQIEGNNKITSFRQKILTEVGSTSVDANEAMIIAEETLRKVDPTKESVKAFKEFIKILGREDWVKGQGINVEDDYRSFTSVGYRFVRILDDEFEYYQPKFI